MAKPGPKPKPKKRGRPRLDPDRKPKLRPGPKPKDKDTKQTRLANGTFGRTNKYGQDRKIGRPRSGRAAALAQLDKVMSEAPSLGRLRADFRLMLAADPTLFFKDIIMPLLPREAILNMFGDEEDKKPIRIIFQPVTGDTIETTVADANELLEDEDEEDEDEDEEDD